jgi:hypothetical protein
MTAANPAPVPPPGFRLAVLICLVLTSVVGVFSAKNAMETVQIVDLPLSEMVPDSDDPAKREQGALVAKVYRQSVLGMWEIRAVILGALSSVSAIAFVCTLRMLQPNGLPREMIRRLLGATLIGTAVLATIDGAQMAVLGQQMLKAGVMADPAVPPELAAKVYLIAMLFWTALLTGAFLGISHYFRSDRVREFVEQTDKLIE